MEREGRREMEEERESERGEGKPLICVTLKHYYMHAYINRQQRQCRAFRAGFKGERRKNIGNH